jgi:LysM repeat protein
VTLSLPVVLGLIIIFIAVGAVLVYYALQQTGQVIEPTVTPTNTVTASPTITSTPVTPTTTNTPVPTPTPIAYRVASGDTCSSIAFSFGVSIQSIVLLNNLPAACDTLFIGQELLIPQPTPTPTALPTATLSGVEATRAACGEIEYLVQENDTLSSISANYGIPITNLKEYNGLVNDTVRSGQTILIPLCAPFSIIDETVTLQWASVGTLRDNEAYQITIVDVTGGEDRKLTDYVNDTKYIVPDTFQPASDIPHVVRWWVTTARQIGTDDDGNPIWEPAGISSIQRVYTWIGSSPAVTPTP